MISRVRDAPGRPGIDPRWTSSAKSGVGTALARASRVWFTLSHGILNEVYYPRLDQACLRDFGLIVTDGQAFFSEEKRDATSEQQWLAPGVPAFRLVNTCRDGRYRIEKTVLADPERDVVLQHVRFEALTGARSDYHLYALLAPHLANAGADNTAWVGEYKGVPMLFAQRDGVALAVACAPDWSQGSAGFVGASDGWQELRGHKAFSVLYERAENGNTALTGEIDLAAANGSCVLALAFGTSATNAAERARASLLDGFDKARDACVAQWTAWHERLPTGSDAARVSAAVLRCHEEKDVPGAIIASLSIPWGDAKSDDDLGGYHLVWPRDLVEAAGGLVAIGACADAHRVLDYLRVTQEADGSWPQNMWVNGAPYWSGVQLDETAFPILLADLVCREDKTSPGAEASFWPMIRRAAGFLVRNGPSTPQDRWEEDAGLAPFTVAVEIAALLVAGDHADASGESTLATYFRETADTWNEAIDRCMYAEDTPLARAHGVAGYYVRIAPLDTAEAASPVDGFVPIKNRPWVDTNVPASEIVSPDALALVRFGLRAPDDPRIVDTVTVIDALLRVETPAGPVWRRYNGDGYGEHDDGAPFDGTGVGRPWPLLTGERAHYELAAGRIDEARRLLGTLEACANSGGLLPEQIWDGRDIPARELAFGRPSGSAMPLVWAHAEHLKLRRSIELGRVFDLPRQTAQRYLTARTRATHAAWRFNHRIRTMAAGRSLRLENVAPFVARWTTDGWRTSSETEARDTGLGVYIADLPTPLLPSAAAVEFTFLWTETNTWEGTTFQVTVRT